ncbi:MAG: aspartate/glutamate racemase family protein [Burkholderiales bacterium]|uniref:glutamate racemase n=1 Tax=Limnobacter sp. TaxID=2003368 RepID=UPI0039BD775B|nr:aspartate/glutamate racemase family protein [Burkholderiales bacterium]
MKTSIELPCISKALSVQAVGVFDSGVGGLSVLKAMLNHLPAERFQFVADERYLPYGDKPQHEITDRVLTLSNWLRNQGCKAMVMACNTATAAGANQARAVHANWPIVGIEPAVKPASMLTKTGVVGILATTNTVASERFKALVERFDPLELLQKQADMIVLGCTHYPFVAHLISKLAGPGVDVIETGLPVAKQLKARLEAENLLNVAGEYLPLLERVSFFTTGQPDVFKEKLVNLLGSDWSNAQVEYLDV